MVSRAFKKMINTLDHGSTKAKKVKTIGTYVERKVEMEKHIVYRAYFAGSAWNQSVSVKV